MDIHVITLQGAVLVAQVVLERERVLPQNRQPDQLGKLSAAAPAQPAPGK